jgi:hypothetical protein
MMIEIAGDRCCGDSRRRGLNWMMQSAKLGVPKYDEDQAILSYEQFVAIALKESH